MMSFLDAFLAFLGMTFGLVSALPDFFFQSEVEASQRPRVRWLDLSAKSQR
jgi:hypothetical protein